MSDICDRLGEAARLLYAAANEIERLRTSRAEIDAIQHVVEDGRLVKMQDYACLRSLLVRLRPEWEDEDDSDRSQPISDDRLEALDQLSALDQMLELEYGLTSNPMIKAEHGSYSKSDEKRGDSHTIRDTTQPRKGTPAEGSEQVEGSFRDSRNANEPVAWAVVYPNNEVAVIAFKRQDAEERAAASDRIVPLYRHPQPALTDAERDAVDAAARIIDAYEDEMDGFPSGAAATLRGLLERLK